MSEIVLSFSVQSDGSLSIIDKTKDSLTQLKSATEQVSGSAGGGGGFGSLVSGAADAMNAVNAFSGAINTAGGMISSMAALGDESRKSKLSLDALSNGASSQFLSAGRTATKGLVDDLNLAQMATDGLARGAFTTSSQFAQIAKDGATLGSVLGTDAAGGISQLENAMEMVGNSKALKPLGLDIQEVNKQFKLLTSEGIDKTTAWRDAVMGAADDMTAKLGPAIDNGPGAATTRLTTAFTNLKTAFAERVSIGIDSSLQLMETVLSDPRFSKWLDVQMGGNPAASADWSTPGINPNTGMSVNPIAPLTPVDTGANASKYMAPLQGMLPTYANGEWSSAGSNMQWGAAQTQYANEANTLPANQQSGYSTTGNAYQQMLADNERSYGQDGNKQDDQTLILSRAKQQQDTSGFTYQQSVAASSGDVAAINAARDRATALREATAAAQDDMTLISTRAQVVQDATAKELAHAAAINSVASAFGLQQNGLYSAAGSTMDSGMAAARAARLAEDQHKGMGAGAINKDMAAFDKEAGSAKDAYALATGGATKESLAFRDAEVDAGKALANGKITVTEYATEIQKLANAAKTGKTSVEELYNIAHPKAAAGEAHTSRDDVSDQAIFTSQAKLADVQKGLITTAGQSVGDAVGGASSLTTYLNGIATNADKATSSIDGVTAALHRSPLLTATQMSAPTTAGPMSAFQQQSNKGLDGASPLASADPFGPMSKSAGDATTKVTAVGTAITTTGGFLDALVNSSGAKGKLLADGFTLPQTATEKLAATLKIVNDLIGKASGTFTFNTNFTLGGGGGGNTSSLRGGAQYQ